MGREPEVLHEFADGVQLIRNMAGGLWLLHDLSTHGECFDTALVELARLAQRVRELEGAALQAWEESARACEGACQEVGIQAFERSGSEYHGSVTAANLCKAECRKVAQRPPAEPSPADFWRAVDAKQIAEMERDRLRERVKRLERALRQIASTPHIKGSAAYEQAAAVLAETDGDG